MVYIIVTGNGVIDLREKFVQRKSFDEALPLCIRTVFMVTKCFNIIITSFEGEGKASCVDFSIDSRAFPVRRTVACAEPFRLLYVKFMIIGINLRIIPRGKRAESLLSAIDSS